MLDTSLYSLYMGILNSLRDIQQHAIIRPLMIFIGKSINIHTQVGKRLFFKKKKGLIRHQLHSETRDF